MIDIFVLILLGLFYILFIGRTVLLMRQGVKVWVISSSKSGRGKVYELLLVPLLVLWSLQILLAALGKPWFALPYFWHHELTRWLGILLSGIGLLIFLWALLSFGSAWRVGIDEKNSDRLVTEGIFAFSRNPIFLFMDLYFLGMFLVYPDAFFLICLICALIGIHIQILREEEFLRKKFGPAYEQYAKRVRRYF